MRSANERITVHDSFPSPFITARTKNEIGY